MDDLIGKRFGGKPWMSVLMGIGVLGVYGVASVLGYKSGNLSEAQCGFIGIYTVWMVVWGLAWVRLIDREVKECRLDANALGVLDLRSLAKLQVDKSSSLLRKSYVVLARHQNGDIKYEPVIKEIARPYLEAAVYVKEQSGLGPILGMIGSIVGLSLALGSLGNEPGAAAMRESLSSAGTAIFTTGAGCCMLLLLRVVHTVLAKSIAGMISEIEANLELLMSRHRRK